jgi:hypothetical protein
MRLLDGTAGKWSRAEHRVPERRFVLQTRGCFRWGPGNLRIKHGCTLTSLRGHAQQLCVASGSVEEFLGKRLAFCRRGSKAWQTFHLEKQLSEMSRAARIFDIDRARINTAMPALFGTIEVDYMNHTLQLAWRHGGSTTIRLSTDIMAIKDGWRATSAIPALRRQRPQQPC